MTLRDAEPGETIIITETIDWRDVEGIDIYIAAGTRGKFISWSEGMGVAKIAIPGQPKLLLTDDGWARRLHPLEALADASD